MIGEEKDAVTDGHGRAFLAPPSSQGAVAGAQGRVLAAARRLCSHNQGGSQPARALAGLAALAFARALLVAGAHTGPGGQMRRRGELLQMRADLGEQDL